MNIQNIFKHLTQAIIGVSAANTLNVVHEGVDNEQRGKSPNKNSLRALQFEYALLASSTIIEVLTHLKWLKVTNLAAGLTFGLPALISFWPKNSNYPHFQKECQAYTDKVNASWARLLFQGLIVNIFNFFVQKTPFIRWIFKTSIKIVDFIDQHLTKFFLALNIASYIGLLFMGSYALAGSALFIYGLGILDRNNLLPMKVRHFMKQYLIPLSLFGSLLYGGIFEKVVASTMIFMSYSHYFIPSVISLLSALNIKKEFVAALKEQKRNVNTFDFQCEAKNFVESLTQLSTMPCEITRAHVLDNTALVPPFFEKIKSEELLDIFDSIDNWQPHEKAIETYKETDWRAKAEHDLDENSLFPSGLSKEELLKKYVAFMRNNIQIFIKRVKSGNLQGVKAGTEQMLDRYIRAIIFYLRQTPPNSPELADKLIYLGFETGEYCPPGLLEVAQASYFSMLHLDKKPSITRCVFAILQLNRVQFFQGIYWEKKLHDLHWEELFPTLSDSSTIWQNKATDMHAYERALAFWAPRLGLPALYFECSTEQDHPAAKAWYDMLSARSPIERKFWKEITIDALKQQIRNGVNTPRLPLISVQQWYHQFIDSHVIGTEEEKDALKELPFYEVEHHKIIPENQFGNVEQEFETIQSNPNASKHCGTVPITKLKEEILHLMLLDLGVIHIKGSENVKENTFRFQAQNATKEEVKEATPAAPIEATLEVILQQDTQTVDAPQKEMDTAALPVAVLQFSTLPVSNDSTATTPEQREIAALTSELPKLSA